MLDVIWLWVTRIQFSLNNCCDVNRIEVFGSSHSKWFYVQKKKLAYIPESKYWLAKSVFHYSKWNVLRSTIQTNLKTFVQETVSGNASSMRLDFVFTQNITNNKWGFWNAKHVNRLFVFVLWTVLYWFRVVRGDTHISAIHSIVPRKLCSNLIYATIIGLEIKLKTLNQICYYVNIVWMNGRA